MGGGEKQWVNRPFPYIREVAIYTYGIGIRSFRGAPVLSRGFPETPTCIHSDKLSQIEPSQQKTPSTLVTNERGAFEKDNKNRRR